jgi:hypothetical protein
MARPSVGTQTWIVGARIDAGELSALDQSPNLMAWCAREYESPARTSTREAWV